MDLAVFEKQGLGVHEQAICTSQLFILCPFVFISIIVNIVVLKASSWTGPCNAVSYLDLDASPRVDFSRPLEI